MVTVAILYLIAGLISALSAFIFDNDGIDYAILSSGLDPTPIRRAKLAAVTILCWPFLIRAAVLDWWEMRP